MTGLSMLALALACQPGGATQSPTAEFDSPYKLRVLSAGTVLEVSGSISWALPQNFQAALAAAPGVRVVRLDSPGGHIQPAWEIAVTIRERGLDTYVGRFCASACTVAFLAGRHRWVAREGGLGFHQAHGSGLPPELANALLRETYERLDVPAPFIAHVLRTPPGDLWFPTTDELRAAGLVTESPPAALVTLDESRSLSLRDIAELTQVASGAAVTQFATALHDLLTKLQNANPEACWNFTHDGAEDLARVVPGTVLDTIAAAEQRMADEARTRPAGALDREQRKAAAMDLKSVVFSREPASALDGLRAGSNHSMFCPSLLVLLRVALGLPEARGVNALRALLSGH